MTGTPDEKMEMMLIDWSHEWVDLWAGGKAGEMKRMIR